MELNERQAECLSTCMDSCRNIAYPSLGLAEETGEYLEKLMAAVSWNENFKERTHLEYLIKGFAFIGKCIGRYAKQMRHDNITPFSLPNITDENMQEQWKQIHDGLIKELGDVEWMLNVASFYAVYADGETETDVDYMTADIVAIMNRQKLLKRKAEGTIDSKGDDKRTAISD